MYNGIPRIPSARLGTFCWHLDNSYCDTRLEDVKIVSHKVNWGLGCIVLGWFMSGLVRVGYVTFYSHYFTIYRNTFTRTLTQDSFFGVVA